MTSDEVQFRDHEGERVIVVASFRDADNDVMGLPASVRLGVLQGVLRAVQEGVAEGPAQARRRRLTVDLVAYEILFALVQQRKMAWGLEAKEVREARARTPLGDQFPRQPLYSSEPPYLLDLVDWSTVEPWLLTLNHPHELRKRYRELKEELTKRGPWVSSWRLHWQVLRRLNELWGPAEEVVDEGAQLRSLKRRRPVWIEGAGIRYSNQCLGLVLEYYGLGQAAWWDRRRGYHVAFWRIHQILHGMRAEGGLDLRSLPWMRGRYWLPEDLPRLPVGDFPLWDPPPETSKH